MNIQSSHLAARPMAVAQQQQPQQPQQPPAQEQPPASEPNDAFYSSFSGALETAVPFYTAAVAAGTGMFIGGVTGGVIGGLLTGGPGGAALGTVLGFAGGTVGGGYLGYQGGAALMQMAGDLGEAHNTENPEKSRAIGQAVVGGAVTLFTGSPVATAVIVGGSAIYALHQAG